MDLIGSINYIENRLGGRKPNQGRGKPAQKNSRNDSMEKKSNPEDPSHPATEYGTRLGSKIDTVA
jgi:hypothetical protein